MAAAADRVRRRAGAAPSRRAERGAEVAQRRAASSDRKVAGILVERVETPDGRRPWSASASTSRMTPTSCRCRPATSLALEAGSRVDRTDAAGALLGSLREALRRLAGRRRRRRRCAAAYIDACVTVGRDVRVDLPAGGALRGRAVGIDAERPARGRRTDGAAGAVGRRRRGPRARRRVSDMIRPWPSPRSCSTPASTSSSHAHPPQGAAAARCWCCRVLLAAGVCVQQARRRRRRRPRARRLGRWPPSCCSGWCCGRS